jgi:S1-C subfamily serine protease
LFGALALGIGCRGAADRAQGAQPKQSAIEPAKSVVVQPTSTPSTAALPAAVAASIPAIVRVESYDATDPKPPSTPAYPYTGFRKQRSGMGVITEVEGYIVTSYSLLSKPDSSELVSLVDVSGLAPDAPHRRATVMGVEPTLDLAILRVEPSTGIQATKLGDGRKIEPGELLFAITGAHDGPQYVAGKLKELASKECYQESMSATMLRVDIDLPKESLGGPIFSSTGELIGLHTRHADSTASSSHGSTDDDRHILPIQLVFNIYEPLKKKRDIASPWTGFSVRSLIPAEQARFPVKRYLGGVVIEYVWKDGPAYKLGLRTGDVLMRFSYYPTLTVADFQKWLYEYGVGAEVTLHVLRGDEILKLPYVIEARPSWAVPR